MAAATRTDIELLTEHFGYPPVSLLDDIINSINILAERAINSIEQGLLNAPPSSLGFRPPKNPQPKSKSSRSAGDTNNNNNENPPPSPEEAHRHEIEAGTHQLETLLFASIDKNFDVFEIYVMRNILCVKPEDREWIRLSHYQNLDFSSSSPTETTIESLTRLRRRLQASQKLNTMLRAERARNASLLESLRKLVGSPTPGAVKTEQATEPDEKPFAFLRDKRGLMEGGRDTPITTTTAFTLSQLQALRALSESLRTIMPDLMSSDSDPEKDEGDTERKKTWRRERLEYVESATRRHLENVRGLDLGRNGEVRDGEWEGGGRSVEQGEVEGLEQVSLVLGGGGRGTSTSGGPGDGDGDEMDES
ncbi:Mis12 protein-domain-containing protein [Echria macrotheca]|uniref:Mis12 protein-domain-containing protein n=1 Tax=Echria macrotheca TaxID=438768 RepID=A0AAJ0F871_9PEZI|nr:Mis12 protein-domain-containing protein [Echria macrotheca]